MKVPLIPEIQRYCVNDGPGIRSLVFFKGCPLDCPWCHNPEYKRLGVDLYFYEDKCVRCGECVKVCPENAITPIGPNGEPPLIDKKKCKKNLKCVDACKYGAREIISGKYDLERAIEEALKDRDFYASSGGGVTISGGEPLLFPEFTAIFAKRLKDEFIHVAVETSAYCRWDDLKRVVDFVDLFLIDIKCMDSKKHRNFIGVGNELILQNIAELSKEHRNIRIRVPVIPEFNDNKENFEMMVEFLSELEGPIEGVDLLPFHNSAEKKYKQLGIEYKYEGMPFMEADEVKPFATILEKGGIEVTIGGMIGVGK